MTLEELEEFYEEKELELFHLDDELGLVYDITKDCINNAYQFAPANTSTKQKITKEDMMREFYRLARSCDFKWQPTQKSFRR